MAHMDGTGHGDTNVVPLALARLEHLIQVRLAESLDRGIDPAITVKVVDSHDYLPPIADDPAFYDAIVDKIVETLDHYLDVPDAAQLSAAALNDEIGTVFYEEAGAPRPSDCFVGRLRCMACGIVTSGPAAECDTFLRRAPDGTRFAVGSHFEFDHDRVPRDYYARCVAPRADEPVHILEGWECPHCEMLNWAEIVVRESLVTSVWSVALSRVPLERAHYVTSECVELASRLTGRPAWALMGEDVFEVLVDELEAH